MIEDGTITAETAKIGYVGAFPFAEVISGYTSFFLGARSVCPSATMEVRYTNSWSDMALEKETAEALIADGCVLISQHSDTVGPATAHIHHAGHAQVQVAAFFGHDFAVRAVQDGNALRDGLLQKHNDQVHALTSSRACWRSSMR